MRSRTKTTQWNLFFQYTSIILMVIWSIVLMPLYLKFIPLDIYGAWLATGNMVAWLSIIDPGLSAVLQQKVGVAYGKQDYETIRLLLFAGLLITLFICLAILLGGWLVHDIFIEWLHLKPETNPKLIKEAFLLAVIGISISLFSFAIAAINSGLQSSLANGIIYVTVYILSLLLIVSLLFMGFGLIALPISLIFRSCGFTLGNAIYLGWRLWSEKIGFSFSLRSVPALIGLLSYTFIGRAGTVIASNLDAFIVARFLGAEIVPILECTRKVPHLSKVLIERPAVAFTPAISHLVGVNEVDKARVILLRLIYMTLWLSGLILGGFITFNDDFISLWLGADLFTGTTINIIICITVVMSALTINLSLLCWALGNIKGNSIATLLQSILQISLALIGVYYFGLIGIVLAPLLAILTVSSWYYPRSFSHLLNLSSQERYAILVEAIKILLTVISLICIFMYSKPEGWLTFTILTLSFTISYGIALWYISPLARSEIVGLFKKINKID